MFLQALARYLEVKAELGEIDSSYQYCREVLLRYARWMAAHEYPYLQRPERLQFPTETWAAQDLRKSEVFRYAAMHANASERQRFAERARFFQEYALSSLVQRSTRTYTRPMVLLLTNGGRSAVSLDCAETSADQSASSRLLSFRAQARFLPQRDAAVRNLCAIAVICAALLLLVLYSGR